MRFCSLPRVSAPGEHLNEKKKIKKFASARHCADDLETVCKVQKKKRGANIATGSSGLSTCVNYTQEFHLDQLVSSLKMDVVLSSDIRSEINLAELERPSFR